MNRNEQSTEIDMCYPISMEIIRLEENIDDVETNMNENYARTVCLENRVSILTIQLSQAMQLYTEGIKTIERIHSEWIVKLNDKDHVINMLKNQVAQLLENKKMNDVHLENLDLKYVEMDDTIEDMEKNIYERYEVYEQNQSIQEILICSTLIFIGGLLGIIISMV